jgi:hypothetical protein
MASQKGFAAALIERTQQLLISAHSASVRPAVSTSSGRSDFSAITISEFEKFDRQKNW